MEHLKHGKGIQMAKPYYLLEATSFADLKSFKERKPKLKGFPAPQKKLSRKIFTRVSTQKLIGLSVVCCGSKGSGYNLELTVELGNVIHWVLLWKSRRVAAV